MNDSDFAYLLAEDNSLFEKTRGDMITVYHSYIQNHVGYLLALIIGFLSLIANWTYFFNGQAVINYIFWLLIHVIFFAGLWVGFRIFYWVTWTSYLLSITYEIAVELFKETTDWEKYKLKNPKPSCGSIIHVAVRESMNGYVTNESPLKYNLRKLAVYLSKV